MSEHGLANLLECFGREQRCYTSLLDLSRRQRELIDAGDIDLVLRVLGQKQLVLAEVADIERELEPWRRRWPRVRAELDDLSRQKLDAALHSVEELLAELIRSERESETALTASRDSVERELTRSREAAPVRRTYGSAERSGSVWLDRAGGDS